MAKILCVVPNQQFKAKIEDIINDHRKGYLTTHPNWAYVDVETTIQTNAKPVIQESLKADVIIARGILATTIIAAEPNVPVVRVPVNVTDILLAFNTLKDPLTPHHKVALIGLGLAPHQVQIANTLCPGELCLIDPMVQTKTEEPISELFNFAVEQGFSHFIGGVTVVRLAESAGLKATLLHSSSESIWAALTQAQHIAEIQHQSRKRTVRFKTIFNRSSEGIIAINADKKIVHINPVAGAILKKNLATASGASIDELIPDSRFKALLNDQKNYSNILLSIKNNKIILNKDVTSLGDEPIGCILTFQKVSNVQSREIKIRTELHLQDHRARHTFTDIIGKSEPLTDTVTKAQSYASVPSNVMIIGETGTGKELFAQSMHNVSKRKTAPFVAINCAAIPDNLIESEFFGYIDGAFSGASKDGKMGFFELAHNGTIFLDEVSEIPLSVQGKLLRVIQEGEVMRLGHDKVVPVDVRIFCATNQDLWRLVEEGKFRADLFFRLSVLHLNLPPLRERGLDIDILADHFVKLFSAKLALQPKKLTSEAKKTLRTHPWVGNIRELSNVCEQLVVLNRAESIGAEEITAVLESRYESYRDTRFAFNKEKIIKTEKKSFSLQKNKRELIVEALHEHDFNRSRTAQSLGIDRTSLWRLMKKYRIDL